MSFTRALKYQLPMMRGQDVLDMQLRLKQLHFDATGLPDGLFGPRTQSVVREFQTQHGLKVDGIVGPKTWAVLFGEAEPGSGGTVTNVGGDKLSLVKLEQLGVPHRFQDGVAWQLTDRGILVEGDAAPLGSGGAPETARRVWRDFGEDIQKWSVKLDVPVELIIATICTESSGRQEAVRKDPGFVSVATTPDRIFVGLMQAPVSRARATMNRDDIDDRWLMDPANAIQAGASYIADQFPITGFDPPKVACAYSAGGIFLNDAPANRWKMRQYPIGSSAHTDRFVLWFNDCFAMFELDNLSPEQSFFRLLRKVGS